MIDRTRLAADMAAKITDPAYMTVHLLRHAQAMGFNLEDYRT